MTPCAWELSQTSCPGRYYKTLLLKLNMSIILVISLHWAINFQEDCASVFMSHIDILIESVDLSQNPSHLYHPPRSDFTASVVYAFPLFRVMNIWNESCLLGRKFEWFCSYTIWFDLFKVVKRFSMGTRDLIEKSSIYGPLPPTGIVFWVHLFCAWIMCNTRFL